MSAGNFISLSDFSNHELVDILDLAAKVKKDDFRNRKAAGKVLGLLFFNPSLRTRVSFETAAAHLGASTSIIQPGQGTWSFETGQGVVMDGDKTEHIREAIRVLSGYCDLLGVRAFAGMKDLQYDKNDEFIREIEKHSRVPVINLESAWEHPCQGLADWLTLRELFGGGRKKSSKGTADTKSGRYSRLAGSGRHDLSGKKFVLTWAPHPNPLPMAVPNSALEVAARSGIGVTLACPPEMMLDESVIRRVDELSDSRFEVLHNQEEAFEGADVIYAKSWAPPLVYSDPRKVARLRSKTYADWTVTGEKMVRTNNARFMHCLPVRRNVVVTDEVLDGPNAAHIGQAENRLHVQKALLMKLWNLS